MERKDYCVVALILRQWTILKAGNGLEEVDGLEEVCSLKTVDGL
jgi:hypothetical protein